jgi:hypothetical protein
MIILPDTSLFKDTLNNLPFYFNKQFFAERILIIRPGEYSLPELVSSKEAMEYVYDGELDARMDEISVDDDDY